MEAEIVWSLEETLENVEELLGGIEPNMVAESTWGVVATAAPLAMATGFVIWDKRWEEGSGFALNCYKSALASVGFFVVVASMGGLLVSGEMECHCAKSLFLFSWIYWNSPWRYCLAYFAKGDRRSSDDCR